ncbi:Ty-1 Copia Retrotransposon [Phytophthora megakarya]|uniref:Ty-1 Copia Retrotransposon n=1 Tax=Phytophthora megakarya TaxID=4795 RepID=A0A225X0X9_9STRA|nr:Ty-1 Copia Retrotransposon [Phytophthora megakarya]
MTVGQKRGGGCYHCHEQEHQVRDCPYLGKHPPTENAGGGPVQKRGKNNKGDKSGKACNKCREANESDDSAYITLSLMNLDKRLTGLSRDHWYLFSGATSHMTNQQLDFASFTPLSSKVRTGGNNWLEVVGVGIVQNKLATETSRRTVLLRGVRYVPELQCSLFSVGRQVSHTLTPEERIRRHFKEDDRADILMRDGQTTAHKDSTNLFWIDMSTPSDAMMVVGSDEKHNVELWHDRLGNPDQNAFNALFRHARWPMKSLGLRLPGGFNCSTCVKES